VERIVVTHLSGSKAKQEDLFPLNQFQEIILGRAPSSTVRFSEEAEMMVGRQHACITRNPYLPSLFLITDLNSRNGTFVNGQRISGTAPLKPGDVVQCGLGGPEFRFAVEPETVQLNVAPPSRPTADLRGQALPESATPPLVRVARPGASHAPVVEPRVEQLPAPAALRSRKGLIVGSAVLVGLIALAAGFLLYRNIRSNSLSEAVKLGAAPSADVGKYGHVHLSGAAAEAEQDTERTAWRLEVAPYRTLGSGRPGNAAADFDKPNGVAFSPAGLLFATDVGNHRVQVWDVKTGVRRAELGRKVFAGEIADIAVTPDNLVLVTDQTRHLVYTFAPPPPDARDALGKPLSPYDYQFKDTRFAEQGFQQLSRLAVDSQGRLYAVDAHRNDVLRFNPDGAPDQTWKFERTRADGDTYLHGSEGIAIDEAGGNLFVASEKDAVIEVFDRETGAYKHQLVGAGKDASGRPVGKRIFFGAARGLTIAQHHLLAVDESAGHIQIFNLSRPDAFNTDRDGYDAPQPLRPTGYRGFFGHAPLIDFEDKTNTQLTVKAGAIIPGQANPPGHFCAPNAIASYTDQASSETYLAIADQCNHRLVVYRWSDIAKAMGDVVTPPTTTLATNRESKPAPTAASRNASTTRNRNVTPSQSKATPTSAGKSTKAGSVKGAVKNAVPSTVTSKGKEKVKYSNNDAIVSGKQEKKVKNAKKEKKMKNKP